MRMQLLSKACLQMLDMQLQLALCHKTSAAEVAGHGRLGRLPSGDTVSSWHSCVSLVCYAAMWSDT